LQEISNQQNISTLMYAIQLCEQVNWQNARITYLQVSLMNTADLMIAVTVFSNFQIQIVLDL